MHKTKYLAVTLFLSACSQGHGLGKPPEFSERTQTLEEQTLYAHDASSFLQPTAAQANGSLWSNGRGSLLGERRAMQRGDILTVVIEINDKAEISNTSAQSRNAAQSSSIGAIFGIQQNLDPSQINPALEMESSSNFRGNGSVKRNEKLTLRVAATVIAVQANGALEISGTQEVRVNNELRELTVTGFVRSADISRKNEVQYDRIASARISYGGRGQLSASQQPRLGYQIIEKISPF